MTEDLASALWLRRLITVAVLGLLALLGFRVIEPFIVPLLWAAILAYLSWPGYTWLLRRLHGRRTPAALLMTALVTLAVIAPLAWLAVVLRAEIVQAYHEAQRLLSSGVQVPSLLLKIPWLGNALQDLATRASQDPHALGPDLKTISDHFLDQIGKVVGGIGRNVVKLFLSVLSLFFVYRGGTRFSGQMAQSLEQLLGPRVHNYLEHIGQTVKAVVYGLVLAALVQGVLVGLGYWVAGVGAPLFLAALTTVCGLIPFAAPAVWIGSVVWLFATGSTVAGVGLLIWGALVMSWTDHFVRPFLISREAEIPFLVVIFGVLGGLAAFGLVGLFLGPVILAVLLAIWHEWLSERTQPH